MNASAVFTCPSGYGCFPLKEGIRSENKEAMNCDCPEREELKPKIPELRFSDKNSFLQRFDALEGASILSHDSPFLAPILSLPANVTVYMYPKQSYQGNSGRRVIEQGLEDHPNIHMVSSVKEADFVV